MTTDSRFAIGVDAGGTGTTVWIRRPDDKKPLGTATAGSGNPRSVGFTTALQNIEAAIQSALQQARVAPGDVQAACLCVAGAGRTEERQQILDWTSKQPWGRQVTVAHDAEAVLAAGSPDLTGLALICGTGSLAWGRHNSGLTRRAGGWGYLFGDEGSAYWIAAQALSVVSQMADYRIESTQLLPDILKAAGVSAATDLIAHVYGSSYPREQIAALAPAVFESAREGDPQANDILAQAAGQLAHLLDTVARTLRLQRPTVALAGSVLVRQPEFRRRVTEAMQTETERIAVVEAPVAGAVALAIRQFTNHPSD